ncbi:hypothetical protein ACFY1L_52095 [Streptomyces sp. NPDC001663]|uniref:hypothetical protein n=1 Tax=Streptomyces sp. NPDC001663 TaxID=3364597 RepID=UPI0036952968
MSAAVEDWVLLADWDPDIDGRESATIHWAIRREDLAARRFGRHSLLEPFLSSVQE